MKDCVDCFGEGWVCDECGAACEQDHACETCGADAAVKCKICGGTGKVEDIPDEP
jgi:hypothetical protein